MPVVVGGLLNASENAVTEFLVALSLLQSPSAQSHTPVDYGALTDAQHCDQLTRLIANVTARLPIMIDTNTREDGLVLLCEARILTTNRSISSNLSDLPENWRLRKQSEWDDEICRSSVFGALVRRGWRVTQNISFQSGERISICAHCLP